MNLTRIEGFHPSHILVHYDELALKGRNRRVFENRLRRNVEAALHGAGRLHVHRVYGRLVVDLGKDANVERCARSLGRVFGISRFTPVVRLPADLDAIGDWLAERLEGLPQRTFAVVCRRANKQLPFDSLEVNRVVGRRIQAVTDWPVRIRDPDLAVHVHLVQKSAYVGFDRLPGQGGLPTGTTGRIVGLVSGGIDSPVALHQLLRRGAELIFLHFHSFPHTSPASQEKVREILRVLLPYGQTARLYVAPFAETQQRIVAKSPAPLRVVLYRRFMLRAAEAIARAEGALATVTGDSLGQVASQTLENLRAIDAVTRLPVLRPLIGMHKAQIVAEARRIGTYEISIEPHDDCCSFLMPRRPATRSSPEEVERAEAELDPEEETRALMERTTVEEIAGAEP